MKKPLWKIIKLPTITDKRGNLTFVEGMMHIPFKIKRVYYIYEVPGGTMRGGHAHKKDQTLIIAARGSFDAVLDDGKVKEKFHLDKPNYGLYVPPMVWREFPNFFPGSICLVLASECYNAKDYVRDYRIFLDMKNK